MLWCESDVLFVEGWKEIQSCEQHIFNKVTENEQNEKDLFICLFFGSHLIFRSFFRTNNIGIIFNSSFYCKPVSFIHWIRVTFRRKFATPCNVLSFTCHVLVVQLPLMLNLSFAIMLTCCFCKEYLQNLIPTHLKMCPLIRKRTD